MSFWDYLCVPFGWLLRVLYEGIHSYGWALILYTLVVKIILLPFQMKSKKSMVRMNRVQPQIKEIQTKYANNQQKMNEEMQELYLREGVNPMSGCLWSLLPFPLLIALYSIIRQPLTHLMMLSNDTVTKITEVAQKSGFTVNKTSELPLSQFVTDNWDKFKGFASEGLFKIDYKFLGIDLGAIPSEHFKELKTGSWAVIGLLLIPVISAVLSYLQSKVSMSGTPNAQGADASARSNRTMLIMMPLISLWIAYTLPAALGLYWIASSFFMMIQEYLLTKYYNNHMEKELSEKEKAKREARLKRMEAAREMQRQNAANGTPVKQNKANSKKTTEKTDRKASTTENGRVGDRPYARGRSFDASHYGE